MVCAGNKVISDSCDLHTECLTSHCDLESHLCGVPGFLGKVSIYGVIGIAFSAVIVASLFISYCCNFWNDSKSANYVAASAKGLSETGGHSANSHLQKKGEDSSEYDLSEEASRMEQRMMLQT